MGAEKDTGKGRSKAQAASGGPGLWLGFATLLALATLSALGVVYATHQSRHLLNELHDLERKRNALQVEWGQLLLEESSLVSQGRIENVAMTELNMAAPAPEDIVVVRGD